MQLAWCPLLGTAVSTLLVCTARTFWSKVKKWQPTGGLAYHSGTGFHLPPFFTVGLVSSLVRRGVRTRTSQPLAGQRLAEFSAGSLIAVIYKADGLLTSRPWSNVRYTMSVGIAEVHMGTQVHSTHCSNSTQTGCGWPGSKLLCMLNPHERNDGLLG
ncbi:hypothetical protein COO60DRAFT_949951 [Scenedesmus sp. NREL 46B-D3]|nr:hypothetical protein COO60DRAFT_949951 [Scenedesmus sp. NREL 46B-D3]